MQMTVLGAIAAELLASDLAANSLKLQITNQLI